MLCRLSLLGLFVAVSAHAADVALWAREKVREHSSAPKVPPDVSAGPIGKLWRERQGGTPVIEFVPPSSLAPLIKTIHPKGHNQLLHELRANEYSDLKAL